MLLCEPHLTFGQIADEWAREVATTPGGLSREKIFHKHVKALWSPDFEDEDGENSRLTIAMAPATWPDGRWVDEHHQRTEKPRKIVPFGRRLLLYALTMYRHSGVKLPPRQKLSPFPDPETGEPPVPWSEVKTEIPWGALDALKPGEYDKGYRDDYLEPLTISKDVFGRWCDEQEYQRPRFWFSEQADAKKRRKAGRKKGTGPYAKKDALLRKKMGELINGGKSTGPWDAAGLVAEEAEGISFESKRRRLYRKYSE
jgi:hypothetical protein